LASTCKNSAGTNPDLLRSYIAAVSGYGVELELRQGLLRAVSVEGLRLEREISIVSRKDVRPTAAALAFIALAHKLWPPASGA